MLRRVVALVRVHPRIVKDRVELMEAAHVATKELRFALARVVEIGADGACSAPDVAANEKRSRIS